MALNLPPTEKSLLKAEQGLVSAMRNNDPGSLAAFLHEKLAFSTPEGQTLGKEEDLDAYRSGRMKVISIEVTGREMEIGDLEAEVRATTEMSGEFGAQPFAAQFLFTRHWVWEDGRWQVIGGNSRPM